MPEEHQPEVRAIVETIAYVRAAERLTAAISTFGPVNDAIARVFELDVELAPELQAALGSCVDAIEALRRAHDFALARVEVSASLHTTDEGGTDDDDAA